MQYSCAEADTLQLEVMKFEPNHILKMATTALTAPLVVTI